MFQSQSYGHNQTFDSLAPTSVDSFLLSVKTNIEDDQFLRDLQSMMKKSKLIQLNQVDSILQRVSSVENFSLKSYPKLIKHDTIGVGMFGSVFRVYQQNLGLWFAQKSIPKSIARRNQSYILNEIRIQSVIQHPSIIKLYNFYSDEYSVNLVMQLVVGENLYAVLNKKQKLDIKTIKKIAKQLINSLVYLHQKQIVHRDLKPENIIVMDQHYIKVCDFGFAYYKQYPSNQFVGTLEYTAPEMASGQVYDQKVDIWSFGIILYEMITQQMPIKGESSSAKILFLTNYQNDVIDYSTIQDESLKFILINCLKKVASQRLSAEEIAKNQWLNTEEIYGNQPQKIIDN